MTLDKSSCLGNLANILNDNWLTGIINDFALVPSCVHCDRTWELYEHLPALSLIYVFDNPYRQIYHSTSVPYVSTLVYWATDKMELHIRKEDAAFNQTYFFSIERVSFDLLIGFRGVHIELKMVRVFGTMCGHWH